LVHKVITPKYFSQTSLDVKRSGHVMGEQEKVNLILHGFTMIHIYFVVCFFVFMTCGFDIDVYWHH